MAADIHIDGIHGNLRFDISRYPRRRWVQYKPGKTQ